MRVAVFGAGGFIGSNLCTYLNELGHDVIAITRSPQQLVPAKQAIKHIQLDLLSPNVALPDIADTDSVIYLAGRAHILCDTADNPLAEYRRLNRDAAATVAAHAARQGVKRFVYMSSIGVNGAQSSHPFREDDTPVPLEAYARSKLEGEQAIRDLCRQNHMQWVILRPPLVYGKNAPGNFRRLRSAIEAGRWLPLAAIRNRRSLIAIENLVQVIEICLRHPGAENQLFLVADGQDTSSAQLVRMLASALGRPARLLYVPTPLLRLAGLLFGKSREISRLCSSLQIDSSKAHHLLNWQPTVSLEQGISNINR